MTVSAVFRSVLVIVVLGLTACSSAPPGPQASDQPAPVDPDRGPDSRAQPREDAGAREAQSFESADYIVASPRAGDTPSTLAARHLGDSGKAWMIEDYARDHGLTLGDRVVIPRKEWNRVGVLPSGHQMVPVLVYHNIGSDRHGRLVIASRTFDEHMRQLKAEGFQTVTVQDFLEFTAGRKQLPRKSVLLAFDDGHSSFSRYARPVLKELGFTATLFVYTDYIGTGVGALSWGDLKRLHAEGFDVQAHSKTHGDLRRRAGEPDASYARRMESELAMPITLFRRHLGRGSEALAYPFGAVDGELMPLVLRYGYRAGFTVRRGANAAFAPPLAMGRVQIYAEMTPAEFARNLSVFRDERRRPYVGDEAAVHIEPARAGTSARARAAAPYLERAETLEHQGHLRQALEMRGVALTIDPNDAARAAAREVEAAIDRRVAALMSDGRRLLDRGVHLKARRQFLAVLALQPSNTQAFETLRDEAREVPSVAHTVQAGDTLASLANLYYGDRNRADVIAESNDLAADAALDVGRTLQVPEIPGVPFLPR
ncbi:MAG TPA: polysaccharide deacetylase family protein [Methylomirabilota bacterium]